MRKDRSCFVSVFLIVSISVVLLAFLVGSGSRSTSTAVSLNDRSYIVHPTDDNANSSLLRFAVSTGVGSTLAPVVETAVFGNVQDAFSNIGNHADASKTQLTVKTRTGSIECDNPDDVRGCRRNPLREPAATPDSDLGLRGMEERAALPGGRLRVMSMVASVTRIPFSIPVRGGEFE